MVGMASPDRLQALFLAYFSMGLVLAATQRSFGQTSRNEIPVVVSPAAAPVVRLSAQELAGYLQKIYPRERFVIAEQLPESGRGILVGSVGADSRGVAYGVYGLLEKLGCGFYLSYDAISPPRREPFSLDGWQLADRPLVHDRLVFNWHNFLSGCSTWNLPDWKAWILQSQKQGYNAIMVHAYGNNPMVTFTFNGKTKPVGYLSTTAKGRDWSTMHVNDVRRMWGGEVFRQAGLRRRRGHGARRATGRRGGIESDKPVTIAIRPILHKAPLRPGVYRLRLWMLDPDSTAPGQRLFTVSISSASTASMVNRVDIFKETGRANRILERSYPVAVGPDGAVEVTLTPVAGKAVLCGAILEPSRSNEPKTEPESGTADDSEALWVTRPKAVVP